MADKDASVRSGRVINPVTFKRGRPVVLTSNSGFQRPLASATGRTKELSKLNIKDRNALKQKAERRAYAKAKKSGAMAPKKAEKSEKDSKDDDAGTSKKAKTGGVVAPDRVRHLKSGDVKEGPVVYWMSRDQRTKANWALLQACEVAEKTSSPVAVVFNLLESYCHAGARQFGFMLRGLKELEPALEKLNIPFFIVKGDATETIPKFLKDHKAACLVTDFAPTRDGRKWRDTIAENIDIPFQEVEAHNVIPTWLASDKRETGARTIRSKIHKKLPEWFKEVPDASKQADWKGSKPEKFDWDKEIDEVLEAGKEIPEVDWLKPGQDAAWKNVEEFCQNIKGYHELRNKPAEEALSNMSPYLHFGQLSAQAMAVEVSKQKKKHREEVDAFLEEAVVRRELSDNYVFYTPDIYDSLEAAADWAKRTLQEHAKDKREYVYTWDQLEKAETHDELWNAAQNEMVYHGKMHGFMRMYWGKKILEWTESPEQALDWSIKLNDKWELDGRDSNGYVGCMWSIAGLHDQGWKEREVFGKIRYMNYNGCKRKFNIEEYVQKVDAIVSKAKKSK